MDEFGVSRTVPGRRAERDDLRMARVGWLNAHSCLIGAVHACMLTR